jgi:hypothetical protein
LNGTEIESNSIPKESLNGRIENVAELLWLSLFTVSTVKWHVSDRKCYFNFDESMDILQALRSTPVLWNISGPVNAA